MSSGLSDFYPGETVEFEVAITVDGSAPNITSDTVTIRLKENKSDTDTNAKLNVDANVSSQGASGIAEFTLTVSDTDIDTGMYYYDIEWVLSGGKEHILIDDVIEVLERSSDS